MKLKTESKKRLVSSLTPLLTRTDGVEHLASQVLQNMIQTDGGPGSGNWGHEGVEGQLGGSAPGGGAHNRMEDGKGGFTSWAKDRKAMAGVHRRSTLDLVLAPKGSIIVGLEKKYQKIGEHSGDVMDLQTGEVFDAGQFINDHKEFGIVAPKSSGPNYNVKPLTDGTFSAERKRKAFKATTPEQADKAFRKQAGELYQKFDQETKDAFESYTSGGYHGINNGLREGEVSGSERVRSINKLTEAIDKSPFRRDTILRRGVFDSAAKKFLGCEYSDLKNDSYLDSLVGQERCDEGFTSCGTSIGTGFQRDVSFEFFCPKGTKAMYVEPFSSCGNGHGKGWDGKAAQHSIGGECETILQRGTTFKITGWYRDNKKKLHISCEVVSQNPREYKIYKGL